MSSIFKDRVSHERIIEKYFSDPAKTIEMEPGDILLNQDELNERLFYVKSGKVGGFLPDKGLNEAVFEAGPGSFVGVYSYFSDDSKSYARVVAVEDSVINYFDDDPFDLPGDEVLGFMTYLFDIVVKELRHRQLYAGNMAHERQETLQKLIQSEKMATLGQVAAGLAHELNNSIGSMTSNLGQLQEKIGDYLDSHEEKEVVSLFRQGIEEGQKLSSADARKGRAELEKLDFVNKGTAKTLSRAGITKKALKSAVGSDPLKAQRIAEFWELGYLIHDMQIAANHATHVIQSVKSAGVQTKRWTKNADVNKTVEEALAILRSMTKDVLVKQMLSDTLPTTEACTGEIIQVWINLIKNAVESLINSDTENPEVTVKSRAASRNRVKVSVIDNGPGIPKDLYERVFQPNFTTKIRGMSFGLGLGLTIVQRIVDEHNGEIKLFSKPGQTKFDVYLPIITD